MLDRVAGHLLRDELAAFGHIGDRPPDVCSPEYSPDPGTRNLGPGVRGGPELRSEDRAPLRRAGSLCPYGYRIRARACGWAAPGWPLLLHQPDDVALRVLEPGDGGAAGDVGGREEGFAAERFALGERLG